MTDERFLSLKIPVSGIVYYPHGGSGRLGCFFKKIGSYYHVLEFNIQERNVSITHRITDIETAVKMGDSFLGYGCKDITVDEYTIAFNDALNEIDKKVDFMVS